MLESSHAIEEALAAVGELLAARGVGVAVIVVGGASLNLLGMVSRSTSDVDIVAQAHRDDEGKLQLTEAEPFPSVLEEAIRTVARDFRLGEHWMNADIGKQRIQGLPPGIQEDLTWRSYGALDVGLVGRRTLIALKLFAAVDRGPDSVHVQDLLQLAPDDAELRRAAQWIETQDASPDFPLLIQQVISHVQRNRP